MGTKSNIGIIKKDGEIKLIYCHWDGYLSYNGLYLEKYYQDPIKVNKLINLGNISSLREEVDIPEGIQHDFNSNDNITTAYGRDRGEQEQDAETYNSIEDCLDSSSYIYLFNENNNKWYTKSERTNKLIELRKALLNDESVPASEKIIMKNKKTFNELNEELNNSKTTKITKAKTVKKKI